MTREDLPEIFIVSAIRAALDYEGIADLMRLWHEETDQQEKNEIVADIQELLDACLHNTKTEK
jgi:hypothetical protein